MSTTLQADVNGTLHVPATLLPDSKPLATYRLDRQDGQIVIAKTQEAELEPFWKIASPEERLAALREWLNDAKTPAGLSDYAVSRDSIYD
jgi:hypothetical protein